MTTRTIKHICKKFTDITHNQHKFKTFVCAECEEISQAIPVVASYNFLFKNGYLERCYSPAKYEMVKQEIMKDW